jgi:outer membrane protein OmpA-like peptidoglycan-associated protein
MPVPGPLLFHTARCALLLALAAIPLAGQQIPARPGLALVYVHKNFDRPNERELLVRVLAASPDEVRTLSRFLDPEARGEPMEEPVSRREMAGARTISFGRIKPVDTAERRPRTIAMASQRLMRGLREDGQADASVPVLVGTAFPLIVDGVLQRATPAYDTLELTVEGRPRKLRALRAHGRFQNVLQGVAISGDWWFLDDTAAAWMVKYEATDASGRTFVMRLVTAGQLTGSPEARRLEHSLASTCRAAVYGFYFATGSAALAPEAAETFATVADVLRRHPDWILTVEGHTDSVGAQAANQQLAERRSAAVVLELATRYGIPASRLTSAGYGAARPSATNGTVEGRARNRRVELVRACPGRTS